MNFRKMGKGLLALLTVICVMAACVNKAKEAKDNNETQQAAEAQKVDEKPLATANPLAASATGGIAQAPVTEAQCNKLIDDWAGTNADEFAEWNTTVNKEVKSLGEKLANQLLKIAGDKNLTSEQKKAEIKKSMGPHYEEIRKVIGLGMESAGIPAGCVDKMMEKIQAETESALGLQQDRKEL